MTHNSHLSMYVETQSFVNSIERIHFLLLANDFVFDTKKTKRRTLEKVTVPA